MKFWQIEVDENFLQDDVEYVKIDEDQAVIYSGPNHGKKVAFAPDEEVQ